MFIHLVKYVIEAAVARITSLVTPQEVKGLAVERLVALGTPPGGSSPEVNYEDLASKVRYIDLAINLDYASLAAEVEIDYSSLVKEVEIDFRSLALELDVSEVEQALSYQDLAGEINYPSLARHIECDDLAGVLDYDLLGEGAAASLDYGKLAGRIDYAALGRCILAPEGDTAPAAPEIDYEKLAEAVHRRAPEAPAPAPAPAPESPSIESTFGAALSARLLAAAVERLLLIADETIRDGKL